MPEYPIIQVRPDEIIGDEGMGSKPKFWFRGGGRRWLFKEAREGTGEDWAEKVVAEVARVAGISAATVELAESNGRRGCASLSFADPDTGETLIHGNEILAGMVLGYDPKKKFHQSDHTLDNIANSIRRMFRNHQPDPDTVLIQLASYLVLDALVGNTDRHHENWGIVAQPMQVDDNIHLRMQMAPSFDHASALGRELLDEARNQMIVHGRIGHYVRRGQGAIFQDTTDRRGVNPLGLVEVAGTGAYRDYFMPTLQRLKFVQLEALQDTVANVPMVRMTQASKDFVRGFLAYTYQALIKLVP